MPRNDLGGPPSYREDFSLPLYWDFFHAHILVVGEGLLPGDCFTGYVKIPHNVVVSFYELKHRKPGRRNHNIISDVGSILRATPEDAHLDDYAIERYAQSNTVPNYQIIPQKGIIDVPIARSEINSWCFHRKSYRIYGDHQLLEKGDLAEFSVTENRFRRGETVYLKQVLTDLTNEEFTWARGTVDYFHFHFFV